MKLVLIFYQPMFLICFGVLDEKQTFYLECLGIRYFIRFFNIVDYKRQAKTRVWVSHMKYRIVLAHQAKQTFRYTRFIFLNKAKFSQKDWALF